MALDHLYNTVWVSGLCVFIRYNHATLFDLYLSAAVWTVFIIYQSLFVYIVVHQPSCNLACFFATQNSGREVKISDFKYKSTYDEKFGFQEKSTTYLLFSFHFSSQCKSF